MRQRYPVKEKCDLDKPEEHFLWALVLIPFSEKVLQPIQQNIAKVISKHLWSLGFRHVDWLRGLANEEGFIHVDDLPEQQFKLQMPHRGPQSSLNAMAIWVPMSADTPDPIVLPDVNKMTHEERAVLTEELKKYGYIKEPERYLGQTAEVVHYNQVRSDHVVKASEVL